MWSRACLWNFSCLGLNPGHLLAVRPWACYLTPPWLWVLNMWVTCKNSLAYHKAQWVEALIMIESRIIVRQILIRHPAVSDLCPPTPIIFYYQPLPLPTFKVASKASLKPPLPSSPSPPPVLWARHLHLQPWLQKCVPKQPSGDWPCPPLAHLCTTSVKEHVRMTHGHEQQCADWPWEWRVGWVHLLSSGATRI